MNLISSSLWKNAQVVALYMPLETELDTSALLEAALDEKKKVLLPRVLNRESMDFLPCTGDTPLRKSALGIAEPVSENAGLDPSAINRLRAKVLFVLPALALDLEGYRLGFGGGFYDRFLGRVDHARLAGLIFSCQLLQKLPRQSWDCRVELIASEKGLWTPYWQKHEDF